MWLPIYGEELHEHQKTGRDHTVYGEIVTISPLLDWPGSIPPGLRVAETTCSIDLKPALFNTSGLPTPENTQRQNLLPLAAAYRATKGEDVKTAAAVFSWKPLPAVSEEYSRSDRFCEHDDESYAVISDGWKLIHNVIREDKPEFELFDHRVDPLGTRQCRRSAPKSGQRA